MNYENIATIKKDLQKIVKKYRDSLEKVIDNRGRVFTPEYPKAMMTGQQIEKGTATINFGYNFADHHDNLNEFANSEAFKTFCEKHSIKVAGKEINADNRVQLRLYY